MLTFPQLLKFLHNVNPRPIVCELLLEPLVLLVIAGGAIALDVVSLAASTVNFTKWFTTDRPPAPNIVHACNNSTQTITGTTTASGRTRFCKFQNLKMMVKALPQISEAHRGTRKQRREEMREKRRLVLAALRKFYSEGIQETEDLVYTVETRNTFLREAINNIQNLAKARRKDIDAMLATVIEMKSGRVCGPVPKWKRDNTPAHAETPKTAAMRKESEPETSTAAVVRPDSDVDSSSADSTYDNRSSGDWYCDYTSSYIESDSSSISMRESTENLVTVRHAGESDAFASLRDEVKSTEAGAGDVHERAAETNAKRRAVTGRNDSSTGHGEASGTRTAKRHGDSKRDLASAGRGQSTRTTDLSRSTNFGYGTLSAQSNVKHSQPKPAAEKFPPIDNIRPGHKTPPLTNATYQWERDDRQKHCVRQEEKRKNKMAPLPRRAASRCSAEGGAARDRARHDYGSDSSDDSEDEETPLPHGSLYNMPKISDQLVSVVKKPLPVRGRYGADLRTVLAEMRLRQKAERLAKETGRVSQRLEGDVNNCNMNTATVTHRTRATKPAGNRPKSVESKRTKQQQNAAAASRRLATPVNDGPVSKTASRRRRYSDELRWRKHRASGEKCARAARVKGTRTRGGTGQASESEQTITSEVMPVVGLDLSDDDALSVVSSTEL